MQRMDEYLTKTVEIEVPPDVEGRVRDRAADGEDLGEYLLDEYRFEYEWLDEDGEEIE